MAKRTRSTTPAIERLEQPRLPSTPRVPAIIEQDTSTLGLPTRAEERIEQADLAELGTIMTQLLDVDQTSARLKGRVLIRAKAMCQHGEWQAWLSDYWPLSASEARRYMAVVNEPKRALRGPAKRARSDENVRVLKDSETTEQPIEADTLMVEADFVRPASPAALPPAEVVVDVPSVPAPNFFDAEEPEEQPHVCCEHAAAYKEAYDDAVKQFEVEKETLVKEFAKKEKAGETERENLRARARELYDDNRLLQQHVSGEFERIPNAPMRGVPTPKDYSARRPGKIK